MGFAQGVSALSAAASNLDVIGNNIANSGTIGFKSGTVQFSDVYAGSKVGLGTQVSGVAQSFTAGSVQSSSRALDVAITNGDGFFRLASDSGEIAYSRNGQFDMDKNGYIVNSAGLRLTGYPVTATGAIAGGSPAVLQMPTASMPPKLTSNVAAQFNLNSTLVPPTAAFDATNPATYNYANAVTIYDSLGNSHEMSTFFVKTGSNAWDVNVTVDGVDATPTPPSSLAFDSKGVLTTPADGKISTAPIALTNGATSDTVITIDMTGTTQFGNDNEVKKLTQDGFTSGSLVSFAIGQDGVITGKYSNEQTNPLGQVVLSSFVNPNGLKSKGDNVWAETAASGQPLTGSPGAGTKLGALASGALEGSNVDVTAELVNLIIAQRTYQANAQTVKTQDQVMQTLMNMR